MKSEADDPPAPCLALPSADVYLSARGMIKNFGDDAKDHAQRRAQDYAGRGDREGSAIWLAIATAIDALRQDASGPVERSTGT